MRHVISFVLSFSVAFCFLGLAVDFVHADKPLTVSKAHEVAAATTVKSATAAAKTPPSKMPREKALIVANAGLLQQNLSYQVQSLNEQIKAANKEVADALAERDAVLKEYDIDPAALGISVRLDMKTGVITRAPSPPATDKPEKTAKADKK